MKRFDYLVTTDLAPKGCSSHFTKWRPGDIKIATRGIKITMASTFVEQFHCLWGVWMRLPTYCKRTGLNFRNSKYLREVNPPTTTNLTFLRHIHRPFV